MTKHRDVIGESTALKAQSHSEKLTILIRELLQDHNITPNELSAIGLSIGPGSYTGLRVGSSVARGLSLALEIPILAISSLKALASQYFDNLSTTIIVPMIDARRDEVYHAIYNGLGQEIVNAAPIIINEDFLSPYIHESSTHRIILCGNGTDKPLPNTLLKDEIIIQPIQLLASHLVTLGYQGFLSKQFADRAYFDLNYIKAPNIIKSDKNHLKQIGVKN